MSITQDDVNEAEQAKQSIEEALETLNQIAHRSVNRGQFDSYIKGALEQACEKFHPCQNYSIQCFIDDLEEEIEDTEETIKALAISLAQDDLLHDLEGLKDRLEYYENGESDEDDEEVSRQCQGLMRIIAFIEQV